jgi:hypothetical protein
VRPTPFAASATAGCGGEVLYLTGPSGRVLKLINPQKLNFIYDQIQGFLGWNAMTMDFILRIVILTVSFFVFNHTLGLLLVFHRAADSGGTGVAEPPPPPPM